MERLAQRGAKIRDASVDSDNVLDAGLPIEQRRLNVRAPFKLPVDLSLIDDFDKLRKALSAAQKPIGQRANAKGGNGQKKIRLYLDLNTQGTDLHSLGRSLATPTRSIVMSAGDIANTAETISASGHFDPHSIEDARARTLSAIVQRQGQSAFRKSLLEAYGNRCAITECDLEEVLEAAHILPFKGPATNTLENGLLLRADIHTLFDRGLIAVDTANWTILTHARITSTQYASLNKQHLRLPSRPELHPSTVALNKHRVESGL